MTVDPSAIPATAASGEATVLSTIAGARADAGDGGPSAVAAPGGRDRAAHAAPRGCGEQPGVRRPRPAGDVARRPLGGARGAGNGARCAAGAFPNQSAIADSGVVSRAVIVERRRDVTRCRRAISARSPVGYTPGSGGAPAALATCAAVGSAGARLVGER